VKALLTFVGAGSDEADYVGELTPYIAGDKVAPIPTYFSGGFGLGSKQALSALAAAPACGIHYLGRTGISHIKGLQIAYIDGTYNAAAFRSAKTSEGPGCRYYTSTDVEALTLKLAQAEGDIDILLTNDWPAGICNGLPAGSISESIAKIAGSDACTDVAIAVRPRYHVAGGSHTFFARTPYLNVDLGAGAHATRFIGLGDVGNHSKQKWMHALGLTPASEMSAEALSAVPQGTTGSPYRRRGTKRIAVAAEEEGAAVEIEQTWRWQDGAKRPRQPIAAPSLGRADIEKDRSKTAFVRNVPFRATEDDLVAFFSQAGTVVDVVRKGNQEGKLNSYCHIQFATRDQMERACQLNGSDLMGRQLFIEPASTEARATRQAKPVEGCWFCLSNPNADVDLVASVGEECYVALDKGAITDRHILVLPVEHYACSLEAPVHTAAEMARYLSALRSCFASEGKELVAFERFMRLKKSGGNHCHINVIAVSPGAAKLARSTFEGTAEKHGFSMEHLPPVEGGKDEREALRAVVGTGEYFVALLPDNSRLVHPIAYGERHPLGFGREVLAELAGVPHRADWKECQSSPAEEAERTDRFKAAFKSFDIMLQDE